MQHHLNKCSNDPEEKEDDDPDTEEAERTEDYDKSWEESVLPPEEEGR